MTDLVWTPHPGQQTKFMARSEREVFYGGAGGGGKSAALLMAPMKQIGPETDRWKAGKILKKPGLPSTDCELPERGQFLIALRCGVCQMTI